MPYLDRYDWIDQTTFYLICGLQALNICSDCAEQMGRQVTRDFELNFLNN